MYSEYIEASALASNTRARLLVSTRTRLLASILMHTSDAGFRMLKGLPHTTRSTQEHLNLLTTVEHALNLLSSTQRLSASTHPSTSVSFLLSARSHTPCISFAVTFNKQNIYASTLPQALEGWSEYIERLLFEFAES